MPAASSASTPEWIGENTPKPVPALQLVELSPLSELPVVGPFRQIGTSQLIGSSRLIELVETAPHSRRRRRWSTSTSLKAATGSSPTGWR